MSSNTQFSAALREWAELFMRRSMCDFIHFIKETGLSMTQLNTLMRLYHTGSCDISTVSDHLGITNAATSQMVQRLVQQGFLERTEDPHDRRVKQLALTAAGRSLIEQSIEARRRWLEELTIALTPEQQANIITALGDLTQAARTVDPGLK
ncbi:MAG: MarR family transcriptional regulator [Anaerolineae bacterium]|nr:MarR family transcriptional regulator [Anaerolineae bacterium]